MHHSWSEMERHEIGSRGGWEAQWWTKGQASDGRERLVVDEWPVTRESEQREQAGWLDGRASDAASRTEHSGRRDGCEARCFKSTKATHTSSMAGSVHPNPWLPQPSERRSASISPSRNHSVQLVHPPPAPFVAAPQQQLHCPAVTLLAAAFDQQRDCGGMSARSLARLRWAAGVRRRVSISTAAVSATGCPVRCLATAATSTQQRTVEGVDADDSRQPAVPALSSSGLSRPASLPVAPWHLTPRPVAPSSLGVSRAAFARRNIAIIGAPGSGQCVDNTKHAADGIANSAFRYLCVPHSLRYTPLHVCCDPLSLSFGPVLRCQARAL